MTASLLRLNRDVVFRASGDGKILAENFQTSKHLLLSADILVVVRPFFSPCTKEAAYQSLREEHELSERDYAEVFDLLTKNEVLVPVEGTDTANPYFTSYARLSIQRGMLADSARTRAFQKAIQEVVKPGDVVLDVGTGTGILSFFAARAGAKKVYAVDYSDVIHLARQLAAANGLADKIEFIKGRVEEIEVPQKVPVIVSEWIGAFLLNESMFLSYLDARDRFLQPGGTAIPSRARMYLYPLDDSTLYVDHGLGYWERPVWGLDYKKAAEWEMNNLEYEIRDLHHLSALAEPRQISDIDCVHATANEFSVDTSVEFSVERDGFVHGFGGYFDLDLSPSVTLDTSPFSLQTHWKQAYFPISKVPVQRHDRLVVSIRTLKMSEKRIIPFELRGELFRGRERVHELKHRYL